MPPRSCFWLKCFTAMVAKWSLFYPLQHTLFFKIKRILDIIHSLLPTPHTQLVQELADSMLSWTVSCRTGPRLPTDFADLPENCGAVWEQKRHDLCFSMNSHPLKCLLLFKLQISPNWALNLSYPGSNKASWREWLSSCISVLAGAPPWPTWTCKCHPPFSPTRGPSFQLHSHPGRKQAWGWEGCQERSFHWFLFPVILQGKGNTQQSEIVRQM